MLSRRRVVVSRPPLGKHGYGGHPIPMKKEKSSPWRHKLAGIAIIKERAVSARDVTVLFQVVHEMLRRVGPHRHPVQFPVPTGEIHHVLLVGAPAVKPAALTQDAYKLGRVGGGNPAAIRQNT